MVLDKIPKEYKGTFQEEKRGSQEGGDEVCGPLETLLATCFALFPPLFAAWMLVVSEGSSSSRNVLDTLQGNPISVSRSYESRSFLKRKYWKDLVVELKDESGKVSTYNIKGTSREIAKVEEMVLSEMHDSDDEKVKLTGRYVGDKFKIRILEVHNQRVYFRSYNLR